jgi:hypothetical protein
LGQQIEHEVLRIYLGVAPICGVLLGRNERLSRLGGESVESHFSPH